MPPLTQRKRLTNEEKLNIIEDSKKPGFCRKKTQVTFSESWGHIRNYSCLLLSKYIRSSSPSFSRNSGHFPADGAIHYYKSALYFSA